MNKKRKLSVFEQMIAANKVKGSRTDAHTFLPIGSSTKELTAVLIQTLERKFCYCKPLEVDILLQYKGGENQIYTSYSANSYSSLFFRIQWSSDFNNIEYFRTNFSSEIWRTEKQPLKCFLHRVLQMKTTVICVEAAELMLVLLRKLKFSKEESSRWNVMDPLIGFWMANSDEPCGSFQDLVKRLKLNTADLMTCSGEARTCKQLDVLSMAFTAVKQMLKDAQVWDLFLEMEVKLTPILARMTSRGIEIDEANLRAIGELIGKKLVKLDIEANRVSGRPFVINSAHQLRRILYDDLKLEKKAGVVIKETAGGAKSTSEAVLKQMVKYHKLPAIVLEYRHLKKLKSTYVEGILSFVKKGNINTIWEQRSAATGRLTSSYPNMQAIPKQWTCFKSGEGKEIELNIRSLFRPRMGYTFLLADFKHIEFRTFAHLADDHKLINIFKQSDDVFMTLAEQWLGNDGNSIEAREKAKRIVYASMYGAGAGKVAEVLNVQMPEAAAILKNFYDKFPGLKDLNKKVVENCSSHGYVRTIQGRIRKLPHIRSHLKAKRSQAERQAVNFVIQGAAADLCKQAMLLTENQFVTASPPVNAHLLLQVHDELVWEVANDDVRRAQAIAQRVMEDGCALNGYKCDFKVPISVSFHVQTNLATGWPSQFSQDSSDQTIVDQ